MEHHNYKLRKKCRIKKMLNGNQIFQNQVSIIRNVLFKIEDIFINAMLNFDKNHPIIT